MTYGDIRGDECINERHLLVKGDNLTSTVQYNKWKMVRDRLNVR